MMRFVTTRVEVTARTGVLLLGDVAVIAAFVAIGERRHGGTLAAGVETFAEFAVGWLVAAFLVGVYAGFRDRAVTNRLGRVLLAWVIAVGVAQGLRYLGASSGIAPAFVAVSIGAGGGLLLAWRLIAVAGGRISRP